MKKALFLLIVIVSIADQSIAQKQGKSKIDSLLFVLKSGKPDTTKIIILNNLAIELRRNNPDTSIYFASQAKSLAIKLSYKMGMANACLIIGSAFQNLGNYEKGLKNLREALTMYDQLLLTATGTEKTGSKSKILKKKASAYNQIGIIYIEQSNYPEALKNYLTALKIFEKIGNKLGVAASYDNIGNIYADQGNFPEALKNHFASLKIEEEIGDKQGIGDTHGNIGNIYSGQGNFPEALKSYFTALKIYEEIGDKQRIGSIYNNIGTIYQEQINYPEALKNYFASLKIKEEIGNKNGIANTCNNIGKVYLKQNKNNEASQYLKKGLSLAKEIGSLKTINESYSGFAALDSSEGNFKMGWEHYKMYIITRDSMYGKEKTRKIMQLEVDKKEALAIAEQEKKDALAQKELQKQKLVRNGFVGGFAIVLLFAIVVFSQRNKIKKGKKRSEELLLNILPAEVATELKQTGRCQAKTFSMVTVMFMDFKDFTSVSEKVSAELLVDEINFCFSAFDGIIQKYKVEKIKTVGDAYICVGGLPVLNYSHAIDIVSAAIEIRDFMLSHKKEKEARGEIPFELRIGIHTGPVVAGIVGVKKFQYDIWGDTVNLAARMEQNSEAGRINISGSTYQLVKDKFNCSHRGKIQAKNKGEVDMYFVENHS